MAKGKKAETLEEVARLMHKDSVSVPADADPSVLTPEVKKPAETVTPDPSAPVAAEAQVVQPTEKETAEAEEEIVPEISEEEKKRRSFQAENEKIKAEMAKVQSDQQVILQNLAVEKAKSEALMNMLAGMQTLRGNGEQPEPKKGKPKVDKEPELWDFIKADDYDRDEALDPRTASGQAWLKFNRAIQRYESAQTFKQQQAEIQEANARELTLTNARELADAYPEFKNVLTGQPDFDKIQVWLDSMSKTKWVALKRALDGKATATNGNGHETPVVTKPPSPEAEIARRASKPAAVATQTSTVEAPPAKKFSPEVENLHKLFGGAIALPADAT